MRKPYDSLTKLDHVNSSYVWVLNFPRAAMLNLSMMSQEETKEETSLIFRISSHLGSMGFTVSCLHQRGRG